MNCKNCGQPIRKITDPWGYDNYRGQRYGWFHPELVDLDVSGVYCDSDRDTEAEPDTEQTAREARDEQRLDDLERASGCYDAVEDGAQ